MNQFSTTFGKCLQFFSFLRRSTGGRKNRRRPKARYDESWHRSHGRRRSGRYGLRCRDLWGPRGKVTGWLGQGRTKAI